MLFRSENMKYESGEFRITYIVINYTKRPNISPRRRMSERGSPFGADLEAQEGIARYPQKHRKEVSLMSMTKIRGGVE